MTKPAKSVLITGCSDDGLGSALAVELHRIGYRVFATSRNTEKMGNLPDGIERLPLDVTSQDSVSRCCAEVSSRTDGTLTMLINNAGVWQAMPMSDTNEEAARRTFDVNFWGAFTTTQIFLPLLLKSRKQGHKTTVVLNTSLAGSGPTPWSSIYGASKAAADYLFEVLRLELSPWDIHVVGLRTGAVKSNMVHNHIAGGPQSTTLPANSLYQIASDKVEHFMAGTFAAVGTPADEWAQMVVRNLEKAKPPKMVFGGAYATMAWAMQYLPLPASLMQGMVNRITGLEAVVLAVKEEEQSKS